MLFVKEEKQLGGEAGPGMGVELGTAGTQGRRLPLISAPTVEALNCCHSADALQQKAHFWTVIGGLRWSHELISEP